MQRSDTDGVYAQSLKSSFHGGRAVRIAVFSAFQAAFFLSGMGACADDKAVPARRAKEPPLWSRAYDTVERRAIEKLMERDLRRISLGDVSLFHRRLVETFARELPKDVEFVYVGPLRLENGRPSVKIEGEGLTGALYWHVQKSLVIFDIWISTKRTNRTAGECKVNGRPLYLNVDGVDRGRGQSKGSGLFVFVFQRQSNQRVLTPLILPEYKIGDIVADKKQFYFVKQHHTATAENQSDASLWLVTGVSAKEYKWLWFQPFGATASQHYYGQTLRWDPYNESVASSPQGQTWVIQFENAHFHVYVAEGTHATYFHAGKFNVGDERLGTQIQYSSAPSAISETTSSAATTIKHWIAPPRAFREWVGHWGYKDSAKGAAFSTTARDGPHGLPLRFSLTSTDERVYLFTKPVTLHNAALRTGDGFLTIE